MRVDVRIAFARDAEVENPVFGDVGEHMIEEPDAGLHLRDAGAVEVQGEGRFPFRPFCVLCVRFRASQGVETWWCEGPRLALEIADAASSCSVTHLGTSA